MPEIAELEIYRRLAGDALGRQVNQVVADDPYYLKQGVLPAALREVLLRHSLQQVHRHGKFLLFDVDSHQLGLHFGMTGHLLVDGRDAADFDSMIAHSSKDWDRFVLHFADGGDLRMRDRRRLGGVFLDPDLSHLGPDVLSLTPQQLATALSTSRAPVKALMLDQARLAGVGNLIADEALWRAGIDPLRPAGSLTEKEIDLLHQGLLIAVRASIERGKTQGGALKSVRQVGGSCPIDGQPLSHHRIRGRTTWFCPAHQH